MCWAYPQLNMIWKNWPAKSWWGFFLSWTELWKTLWSIYSPICWHIHINRKRRKRGERKQKKKAKLWLAVLVAIILIYLRVQTRPNLTWPRATSGPNSVSLHINKRTISQCWSTVHTNIPKHDLKETFQKIQTLASLCLLLPITVNRSRVRSGKGTPHDFVHHDQG